MNTIFRNAKMNEQILRNTQKEVGDKNYLNSVTETETITTSEE
jgi:hypothetical protein